MQLHSVQYGPEHEDSAPIAAPPSQQQSPIHNATTIQENEKELLSEKLKNYFVVYPLFLLIIWSAFYVFWDEAALPGGSVFTIIILEAFAYVFGEIVSLTGLPPQLGMLVAGILLGNIPYTHISEDLYQLIMLQLRSVAIIVSITKGALGIFPGIIWKYRRTIAPLAILPYFAEASVWYLGCHYFAGHSSSVSFFVGGLFSTMSGILLFPYLNNLENEMHSLSTTGDAKLSPHAMEAIFIAKRTMGLDAVFGIMLSKSALGFMFADDFETGFIRGPGEVLFGAALGIFWGGLAGILLTQNKHVVLRVITTILGGIVSFIGMRKLGYPRGTHVAVLIGAFTAITIWRRQKKKKVIGLEKIIDTNDKIWKVVEPFLFSIIGARIDIRLINWRMLGLGFCVWAACTMVRLATVFFSTQWSGLVTKERLFFVIAWAGKGTLLAAIGTVPMETAVIRNKDQDVRNEMRRVMELAVLTLIFSNIFGYVGVKLFGRKLLTEEDRAGNGGVIV